MTPSKIRQLEDEIKALQSEKKQLIELINEQELANDYVLDEIVTNLYRARKENNRAEMLANAKTIIDNLSKVKIVDPRPIPVKLTAYVKESVFTPFPFGVKLWLKSGNIHLIGAFPGVGKTTTSLNICYQLYKMKMTSVFFSLEQVEADIWIKLCQLWFMDRMKQKMDTRVLMDAIAEPDRFKVIYEQICIAIKEMESYIKVVDCGGWTVTQLIAEYDHQLKQTGLNGIRLVVVDYFGIIKADAGFMNMVKLERMERNVLSLTEKAKRTKSAWIVLSQLTRRPPNDKTPPNSSWFKETSTLEENAGQCLILKRDKLDDGTLSTIVEMHCVKNRYGRQGIHEVRIENETGLLGGTV